RGRRRRPPVLCPLSSVLCPLGRGGGIRLLRGGRALSAGDEPDAHGAVAAAGEEAAPVAGEGDLADVGGVAVELVDLPAGGRRPQQDGAVLVAGGGVAAAGREGDAVDVAAVAG